MSEQVYENISFENNDYRKTPLRTGLYENCSFNECDFSGGTLAGIIFIDCTFEVSNLGNADLTNTSFQDCDFIKCKMIGLRFDQCKPLMLSFSFESCMLSLSSFVLLKIPGTRFDKCNLQEVDLSEANLKGSVFHACDMYKSVFDNTILEDCDFRSATNYSINPGSNYISGAKFTLEGIPGLLDTFNIKID